MVSRRDDGKFWNAVYCPGHYLERVDGMAHTNNPPYLVPLLRGIGPAEVVQDRGLHWLLKTMVRATGMRRVHT